MENNFDLAKWLAGEMTGSELEAFEKSPEFETYQKIKTYSGSMEAPVFDTEKSYQNVIKRANKKPAQKQNYWFIKLVAATIVISLGTVFYSKNKTTTQYAEAGQKITFSLPDHSEIVLNSNSKIKYKKWKWKSNRNLQLEGEAFFKVAKGETFDVNTSLGKVTVVGTQFNVKSRNQNFEVACYEGKVKVAFGNKNILLEKGNSVTVQNGTITARMPLGTEKPSWLLNEIQFNNSTLDQVLSEVQSQYGIEIEHSQINSRQYFTGAVPTDNIDTAMTIIGKAYHLNYIKTSDKKIILKKE
ncbi:FecR family protein [Flavobacterium microcysteis]|jgi:ferric-dicitrate binding protein FerR (iron transport regulator)|uniref:DUF4974 domain-containing protein n=1 Tax=Flavobacterium microcysteis TaxID=2596891 RepID=A0A501Q0J8_9FLAO|nr:FecR family protein [Flavobacterium microcysteis]TPD65864.1 DUF4974 domain-containing protein [Flavobacterium microcysteis]